MGIVRSLVKYIIQRAEGRPNPSSSPPASGTPYDDSTATAANGAGGRRPRPYRAAFGMARDADARRAQSLNITRLLGITLVIVGAIFLGLTLGGKYPAPKSELEAAGIYTDYVVKNALNLGAGLAGIVATVMATRALASGRSTLLAQAILLSTVLAILATVGLTIYLMTVDLAGYSAGDYVLNTLLLIQRLLYAAVASMALHTLREVDADEAVAEHVAKAQGVDRMGSDDAKLPAV